VIYFIQNVLASRFCLQFHGHDMHSELMTLRQDLIILLVGKLMNV
jgi:hypothetical protein